MKIIWQIILNNRLIKNTEKLKNVKKLTFELVR
jgi:hypothetical protein